MDAVRVLPQVARVEFDIPTETFTVEMRAGAVTAPVLAAIRDLGYAPEVLDATPAGKEEITHLHNPKSTALREALARAKSRGVPLVIDFGGPFCHLCREFEKTSLTDERVRAKLASFEFVQVDVEEDADAAKDLDVHGVPDVWILDGTGKMLARYNGFLDPTEFLVFLMEATK